MEETNNQDITPTGQEETESPRWVRQGKSLHKPHVPNFAPPTKREPPPIIDATHRRPQVEPQRKPRDTEVIAQKRAELERLQFELDAADRERRALESRLYSVENQISGLSQQLSTNLAHTQRLESRELPERFTLLFRQYLNNALGPQDSDDFCRLGTMLSNKKLLLSALQTEAKALDDQLLILEKEKEELREKLGPDDVETESV